MQWWPFTSRESDMNGHGTRTRLTEVAKQVEALQAETKELTAAAERTKAELINAANGSYVKVREMLNGARFKG